MSIKTVVHFLYSLSKLLCRGKGLLIHTQTQICLEPGLFAPAIFSLTHLFQSLCRVGSTVNSVQFLFLSRNTTLFNLSRHYYNLPKLLVLCVKVSIKSNNVCCPHLNLSRDNGRQVFPLSLPPLSSQTLLYCFRANPPEITTYLQLTTCIICGHLINSFGAVLDIWSSFLRYLRFLAGCHLPLAHRGVVSHSWEMLRVPFGIRHPASHSDVCENSKGRKGRQTSMSRQP